MGLVVLLVPRMAAAAEGAPGSRSTGSSAPRVTGRRARGLRGLPAAARGRPVGGPARPASSPRRCPRTIPGRAWARTPRRSPRTSTTRSTRRRPRPGTSPPAIELSRLTVRQYRNAVADLIGSFRAPGALGRPARACAASTSSRAGSATSDRVIERIDPEVRFDFGESSPDPEKIDPDRFSIRWEGSVLAPETGEYEFIVRTEHAARLWVNDNQQPLIDAWVKSGNDTEYRATIFLLGGRAYPLRLEFSKAKQGVDDSKKNKAKPPPVKASIALEWKPPHRAAEVIPARNLSPSRVPRDVRRRDPVPAGRPQRRLRARDVGLEGVGPGHDRRGDRGRGLRRRPPPRAGRASATAPPTASPKLREFCRQVRRAGVPPAADRRAEAARTSTASSRRPATRRRPSSGSCCSS